jgi:cytochrome c biogenesis protein CcmG, thiol:disulfide interchange protein DsbE
MRHRRLIAVGVALLAGGGLVAAEIVSGGSGHASRPAPALPTQVLSGPRVSLASLRGRPAVVNFWASWCAPCKQEAPELERFAAGLDHKASLVGVDWNDGAASARAFVARNHWSYSVLRDARGDVGNAYGLNGLPTSFVIDPSGKIVQTLPGPQTAASLKRALSSGD